MTINKQPSTPIPATRPKVSEPYFIFTFGIGQEHHNHYRKFYGTEAETREQMFQAHGDKWSFQYPGSKEKELVKRWVTKS